MGPKNKSKALFNSQKQARETANLTLAVKNMTSKIDLLKCQLEKLNEEFSRTTYLVQLKTCELSGLKN